MSVVFYFHNNTCSFETKSKGRSIVDKHVPEYKKNHIFISESAKSVYICFQDENVTIF